MQRFEYGFTMKRLTSDEFKKSLDCAQKRQHLLPYEVKIFERFIEMLKN